LKGLLLRTSRAGWRLGSFLYGSCTGQREAKEQTTGSWLCERRKQSALQENCAASKWHCDLKLCGRNVGPAGGGHRGPNCQQQ
jgi:hypothetical protein